MSAFAAGEDIRYVDDMPEDLIDQVQFRAGKGTDDELVATARWLAEHDPAAPEGGYDQETTIFVLLSDLAVVITTDLFEAATEYTVVSRILNPQGRNVEVFLNPDGSTHVVHSMDEVEQLAEQFGITGKPSLGSPDLAA